MKTTSRTVAPSNALAVRRWPGQLRWAFALALAFAAQGLQAADNPCIWGPWTNDTYPSFTLSTVVPEKPCAGDPVLITVDHPSTNGRLKQSDNCGNTEYSDWPFSSWTVSWTNFITYPDQTRSTNSGSGEPIEFEDAEGGDYELHITVIGTASAVDAVPAYSVTNSTSVSFTVECCACDADGTCPDESSFSRAGVLFIHTNAPGTVLGTPHALHFSGSVRDVETLQDANGLRQALAPEGLADVGVLNASSYAIRFYQRTDVLPKGQDGYYQTSGVPVAVCLFEYKDNANSKQLWFARSEGDDPAKVSRFVWTPADPHWTLVTGGGWNEESGLRFESLRTVAPDGEFSKTETREVRYPAETLLSKRQTRYKTFAGKERVVSEATDPDGANLVTTYEYDETGRLLKIIQPDGSWTWYEYNAAGQPYRVYSSFLNQAPTTNPDLCRMKQYAYTSQHQDDDGTVGPHNPRLIIEKLLGQEIARTYRVITPGQLQEIRCQTPQAGIGAADNLVTVTKTNVSGPYIGELLSVRRPDGTMDLYAYATNAEGTLRTNIVSSGQPDANQTAIVAGTSNVTILGTAGQTLSRTMYDIASGLAVEQAIYDNFDAFHRPGRVDYLDGTFETFSYACCGLASKTDRQGIATSYDYDSLGRQNLTLRDGITTLTTHDAEGRVLSIVRRGTDSTDITRQQNWYDVAGRLKVSVDALGAITTYTETQDDNGQTIKTTTSTNGATRVETYAKDGALLSLTGSAVHPRRYLHGVQADGGVQRAYRTEVKLGAADATNEWITTFSDMLGRDYKTLYPDGAYSQRFFNAQGQLWKERDPDGVVTLHAYNAQGEREYTALDFNQNDTLDLAGSDRVTRTLQDVLASHGFNVRRTRTYVWTSNSYDVCLLASTHETAVNGLASWSASFGLTNETWTVILGEGSVLVTNIAPDRSYTLNAYENGRLLTSTRWDTNGPTRLSQTTYGYDAHGRLATATDARTGTTTYTYNHADQVTSVTTPPAEGSQGAQTTTTEYDLMGRPWRVVQPDGTSVTNAYFLTGELKKTTGSRTYPVEYTYDPQGRMTTLKTWQDYANETGAAVTTWNYDPQRGWLSSKRYQDNLGPDYTYTPAGRLRTRAWARGNPRVTTTNYYTAAGTLLRVAYSDATPGALYSYDRRDRPTSVSHGSATTLLTYHDAGPLLLQHNYTGSLGTTRVTNSYDALLRRVTNAALRSSTFLVGTTNVFDTASRLLSVSDGTHTAEYGYLTDSPLVEQITFRENGNLRMITRKAYDGLNRLTSIVSSNASAVVLSSNAYHYNLANQRIRRIESDASYWLYAYDSLGQVTNGWRYTPDDQPMADRRYAYLFDDIGNRDRTITNTVTSDYTANLLNQYTTRVTGGQTETFSHDADGNLTNDGRWSYQWDAENRLTVMATLSGVTPERRLAFEYDWQGRRIRKRFWNNREGTGTPATDLRFLYDGWNLLAVLNSAGSLVASFTWGTDLSGSAQGAGGVGGLLAISDSQSGTHFPAYDGNGNVMALLHAPNSTLSAQYEYGPFGETLSASGAMANANPFRFSTKYQDDETGLLYYGYRYYDPLSGRWPSRDPIAEGGGINLYGFLLNRPLAETDLFGLATYTLSSGKKWAYSFGFITLGGANGVRATLSATSEDLCSFDGNVVVTPRITERAFWHVYTHKTTASFFFADRKCSKYRCNVQCFKYRKDVTWQSSSIVPRPLPSIYHMYQAVTVEFTVCADGIGNTASSSGSQRGYNLDQFFTLEDF